MQERIDLVVIAEERRKASGLSVPVIVSLVLHALLVYWFYRSYKPIPDVPQDAPMTRFVELMKQPPQPQQERKFVEAPGPAVEHAPVNAPLSDKTRKASMPEPTGIQPTTRPGRDGGLYTPPAAPRRPRGDSQAVAPPPDAQRHEAPETMNQPRPATSDSTFQYREPVKATVLANLKNVVAAVGAQVAERGSPNSGDGSASAGGEKGYAEQGPLSFETQWYDWGEYAQNMVSRLRVNWYANMPQLIRTGMKGVVTIRFTIQRDGRITDITVLETSGVPPYDHAARKAIELSSPLKPLPADFPNSTERVTCMFYYNMQVPR